jgi:hypothetical protein
LFRELAAAARLFGEEGYAEIYGFDDGSAMPPSFGPSLDALNVEPPLRQVVVDRYVELLNASVWRVAKCNLRPERVLVAFADQESSRLVNPDVRRSVQIYLAEIVLIADDPLFKDRRETGTDDRSGS